MADIRQVTEQFAVAPQLELDEFAAVAALGYTHIINNRPDGEGPDQPSSAQAEAAAKAAGLSYVHAPFVGQPTPDAVKAAAQAKGKTLAYCRCRFQRCIHTSDCCVPGRLLHHPTGLAVR